MGEPVKILDLAREPSCRSALQAGNQIDSEFTAISSGDSATASPRGFALSGTIALQSFLLRYRRVFGEAVWICAGQVVAVVGMMVGLRWLTAMLSPLEYGRLALGMTFAMLAQTVLIAPLTVAAQRFFAPALEAGELAVYLAAIRRLFGQVLVVIFGISVLVVGFCLATGYLGWAELAAVSFMFAGIAGGSSVLDAIQTAARRRVVVAVHQAASQWLRFIVAVVLVVLVSNMASTAMLGYAVASAVVLVSQWIFLRQRLSHLEVDFTSFDSAKAGRWRSDILGYMWPFVMWGVFTWMQSASDRWALELFGSSADVGYYAVLYQVGFFPLSFASGVIVQLVSPIVFSQAGNTTNSNRMQAARRMVMRITAVLLVATLVAFVLAKCLHSVVFGWFIDARYHSVSHLMPWIVFAGGLFATAQSLALNQLADMNTRQLIAPKIGTALVGIGLNLLGAWQWGIIGLITANCVTSGLYFAWMFALAWNSNLRRE